MIWCYIESRALLSLYKLWFLFSFHTTVLQPGQDWNACHRASKMLVTMQHFDIIQKTYQLMLHQCSIPWAYAHITTVVKIKTTTCLCACAHLPAWIWMLCNTHTWRHGYIEGHTIPAEDTFSAFCSATQARFYPVMSWMLILRVKGLHNSNMAVLWPFASTCPNC